jgi:hypothetical protein
MGVYAKTIVAVMIVALIDRLLVQASWWRLPEGTLEIFFSVFGVVYAIIVGFAMYEALSNYSQIRQFMNSEVNELQDLRDYLMYVDGQDETKMDIEASIKRYVQSVVENEWPAMSENQPLDIDTPDELYKVMQGTNKLTTQDKKNVMAVERLINTIANVTTHRTNRITASVERLPSLLVQLLSILSLFMIAAFTLIPIDATSLKLMLTVANSFGIAFTYFVILDLDYPFRGVWSLQPRPFEHFIQRLESSQT